MIKINMIKVNKYISYILILMLVVGLKFDFILSFLWITLHELAHYYSARAMGIKNMKITIIPLGTSLYMEELDDITLKQDIIISMAGPMLNLLFGIILFIINGYYSSPLLQKSMMINAVLLIFNIMPAFPLDGARLLRDILSTRIIYKRANKITVKCSFIIGFILCGCFIFLLFFKKVNITLIFASLLILLNTYKEKERIVYIIMADIIKKRTRFIKYKYIENKSISIHYKNDLISALSILDKNKFNIFTVLDDDMKVLSIIYESEIIEELKIRGNMSLEEFIKTSDEK